VQYTHGGVKMKKQITLEFEFEGKKLVLEINYGKNKDHSKTEVVK